MPKRIYILVLMLISVKFWGFALFAPVFSNINLWCLMCVIWLVLGLVIYKADFKTLFGVVKYRSIGWLIALSLLLSSISTILFYGQSIQHSILALKEMVFYLSLPLLLIIKPPVSEIKKALYYFSFLFFFAVLVATFLPNTLFLSSIALTEALQETSLKESGDYLVFLEGVELVAFAFIFAAWEVRSKFNLKSAALAVFFLLVIFLMRNRSTLIPCALISLFVIITMKGETKNIFFVKIAAAAVVGVFILTSIPQWMSLVDETTSQMGDKQYSRYLSYAYFMFEAWPNMWCFIFGNGFLYGATAAFNAEELGKMGIWSSDVGFVGMWSLTGFIPVLMILVICIICLFGKKKPVYLRMAAFYILATSATTAWYYSSKQIVWISMFFYLVCLADCYQRKVDYLTHSKFSLTVDSSGQ